LGARGWGGGQKRGVIWVQHPTDSLLLFIFYADSIEMFCAIAAHKITAGWRLARSGKPKKKTDSGPRALELCKTMTAAIKICGSCPCNCPTSLTPFVGGANCQIKEFTLWLHELTLLIGWEKNTES